MRINRTLSALCALFFSAVLACTDGDAPLETSSTGGPVALALSPTYSSSAALFQNLPVNRVRLTALLAGTTTVLAPTPIAVNVDPNAQSWSLPLEFDVPSASGASVEILIELINRSSSGQESVQFSGRTAPLQVSGGENPPVANVTVHPGPPQNLQVSAVVAADLQAVTEGAEQNVSASVVGPSEAVVAWTTLDPTLVEITPTDTRSARIRTLLPGNARIVAAAGPRADTVVLAIRQAIASVALGSAGAPLTSIGQETTITARVLDPRGADVTGATVVWELPADAPVTHLGGGRFRALRSGSAVVTARAAAAPQVTATATLSVDQRAAALTLSQSSLSLRALGASSTLSATAQDALQNPVAGRTVAWSSSNSGVASVDANGVVTAVANGSATISATLDDVTASAAVTVQQVAKSIVVSPNTVTFAAIGETRQLSASAQDSLGNGMASGAFTWVSSNGNVVSVDGNGLATAKSNGEATVTVSADGVSGGVSFNVQQVAKALAVSPTSGTLNFIGATRQLSVEARDANDNAIPNATANWSSTATNVVTVDGSGLVRAVGVGTATVHASRDDLTASASFEVRQVPKSFTVSPTSVQLNYLGATRTIDATAADSGGTAVGVSVQWTSSDGSIASVDGNGKVTAHSVGSATITASSSAGSGSVAVSVSQIPASLTLAPGDTTLKILGSTVQFTAAVRDSGSTAISNASVSWSSSDASRVSISSSGLATAHANGTATITASSGSAGASAKVTVEQGAATLVILDASEFETVHHFGSDTLEAEVRDAQGNLLADAVVEWSSSNSSVLTIDQTGFVQVVGNGTAIIRAVSGLARDSIIVTVEQAVGEVRVNPEHIEFTALGRTANISVTATDSAGVVVQNAPLVWRSGNPAVAMVDGGLVTATGVGDTWIHVSAGDGGDSTSVRVRQLPTYILITPDAHTFTRLLDTKQLVLTLKDDAGADVSQDGVSWTSSDSLVATVSGNGLVTSKGLGSATISAQIDNVRATAAVTVQQQVASVVVSAGGGFSFSSLGETRQFMATARDGGGNTVTDVSVAWSSSAPSIASVSSTGLVTAHAVGTAIISATAEGVTGKVTVSVEQAVSNIVVTAAGGTTFAALTETKQLTAVVQDANGKTITGAPVAWSSSNTGIASVSGTGLVTSVANGTVVVTAMSSAVSKTITLTVSQVATALTVTPDTIKMNKFGATPSISYSVTDAKNVPVNDATVTWSTSNSAIATVGSVGDITAVGNGTAKIFGTSGTLKDSIHVSVQQVPLSVSVSPTSAGLSSLGATQQLSATVRDSSNATIASPTLTWTSRDTTKATVSSGGLVTAVANGDVYVIATSGSAKDSARISILQQVATVELTPDGPVTLNWIGDAQEFTAVAKDARGNTMSSAEITWQASDESKLNVGSNGFTLAKATTSSAVYVKAISGNGRDSTAVNVQQIAKNVDIAPGSATLVGVGSQIGLIGAVRDSGGTSISGATITWSSKNTSVATVNSQGLVTAAGLGTTYIFGTSSPARDSIQVTVSIPDGATFIVSPGSVTFDAAGATQQFASSILVDGVASAVSSVWSSSDTAIARVDTTGFVTVGLKNGTATITAVHDSLQATASVVVNRTPVTITVTPTDFTLVNAGSTQQLSAVVKDGNGQQITGVPLTWVSSNSSKATVSSSGLVTAVANGSVTITVSVNLSGYEHVKATAHVVVSNTSN